MIYVQLFWAFFISGILGYGGGPASIPLIEEEVVGHYGWLTVQEFSEVLALGNALPGPIATKMAGYIGYEQAGIMGAATAVFASVAPSLVLMLVFVGLLMRYKESPRVKRLTVLVRPVIAVLLGMMAFSFFSSSYEGSGLTATLILVAASYFLLEVRKVSPVYVIIGSLIYGAFFLG